MTNTNQQDQSAPLVQELDSLAVLGEIGIRLVPEFPTAMMCKAACSVSDLDVVMVQRIYQAMLIAAINCPLHGDHSLN